MAVGTEAKVMGLERRSDDVKGTGGRTVPPSPNPQEGTMKRRMKMERRER
jgi:hypothetical protein